MAIKTKEELLEAIRTRIGDDTSDETITFLEDVIDTLTDYEEKSKGDGEDWKAKYEENDKSWREKYRERFFSKDVEEKEDFEDEDDEPKSMSYDDLFEESEEK